MKGLLWASLTIVIIIVIQELFWLGKSELAWVILGLAVAMGLQVVYLLIKEKKKERIKKSLLKIGGGKSNGN